MSLSHWLLGEMGQDFVSASVFCREGKWRIREVKWHVSQVRPKSDGTDLVLFASSTWNEM